MLPLNQQEPEQRILAFFKAIELDDSLSGILRYYRSNPELLNCHHPVTKLRPIDYASALGRTYIVEFLLLLGADPNAPNKQDNNKAPIHYAAQNGHSGTIKFLVENGADPDARDSTRKGILAYAKESGNAECIDTCTDQNKLLSVNRTIKWQNPTFIELILSLNAGGKLRDKCPRIIRSILENKKSEYQKLVRLCLDDNLEYFQNNLKFYSEDQRVDLFDFFLLALAFNRPTMINYLIKFIGQLSAEKIHLCFACAAFSGETTNIDKVKELSANVKPDFAVLSLAITSCSPAMVNKVLTLNTDLEIDNIAFAFAIDTQNEEMQRHIRILMIAQQEFNVLTPTPSVTPDNVAAVEPLLLEPNVIDRLDSDVWAAIIPYTGQHASSLAQTSRFFAQVTRDLRRKKMQHMRESLGPLATAHLWNNLDFITAVFNLQKHKLFIGANTLFCLYSHHDIYVWCVLDDNVEQFRRHDQLSIEQHKRYLELAIVFGRINMVKYLLNFVCTFSTSELENLYSLAVRSGLTSMVDVVLNLKDKEIPDDIEFQTALECTSSTNAVIFLLRFKRIPEMIDLLVKKGRTPDQMLNVVKRFKEGDWQSFCVALDSGNLEMIDKIVKLNPGREIEPFDLRYAAKTGNVAVFNKLLQMNATLKIDERILVHGIKSGNLAMLDRILALNNSLICEKNALDAALFSGNVKMFDRVVALIKTNNLAGLLNDPLDNAMNNAQLQTEYLNNAVRSGNPNMVDRLISLNKDIQPNDETLYLAVLFGNPAMVDKVLALYPHLTADKSVLNAAANSYNPHMVNKVLQLFPTLTIEESSFTSFWVEKCPQMFEHLKSLRATQLSQESTNKSAISMGPGGRRS